MPDSAPATPLTLPEMLQKLVRERATGVLRVQGAEGWKVLEIQAGTIHLVTGTENKRLRIGDILVARGKITHEDVQEALEGQRRTGQPLGEVLVQRGRVTRVEIHDVVRFQIEEEVYDLFTWKEAECTFEQNSTLGEQINAYPDVATLAMDPQRILTEAAQRIPVWQRIENVIYSTHMSFRLTERGESMLDTATRGGRKLLGLVQDGYSVDFIVRKAMVGRFSIWKALADLVDAQAVTPIPDDELDEAAQGWESEGKLEQALGSYLRLIEVTPDQIKNGEYRGKVRVLREQIEALEAEEHQAAAARKRPGGLRTPVLAGLTILIVIGAAAYVTFKVASEPAAKDLGPYHEARIRASEFEKQNKLAEAREVWEKYLARYPEGGGAELAQSARERIDRQYEQLVEIEIDRAQKLGQDNRFAEAIRLYDDVLVRYPLTKKHTRIAALRARAETDAVAYTRKLNRQQVAETLKRGQELVKEERYSEAMSCLRTVVDSGAAGPELRNRARKLLEVIQGAERKAEALVVKAQALEQKGELDGALKVYKECYELWAKSRSGRTAADKLSELGQDQARAERLYKKGLRLYAEGDFTGAVGNLKRVALYKGFHVAELAGKKLVDLAAASKRSAKLLQRAARLEARGLKDEAFKTLVELVERYPHTLAAKNTRVEVRIESVPAGAQAKFNGRGIGATPVTLRVSPRDSGTIVLTKPGFAALEKRLEKIRSPVMLCHLQREELFRRKTGRQIKASPVGAGDRMAVRSGELLTLFVMANGAPIWQTEVGPPANPRAKPAVLEDTIYVGGREPRLVAFYLTNGRRRAEYALPSPAVTTPVPIRLSLLAGRLFVIAGCQSGEVVSLDVLARRRHWSARVTPPIRFDPAVTQAAVVVASPGGQVVAFDVLRGHERWRENVPGEVACDLATDAAGEYVAAITSLGELYIFSATDGGKIARILVGGVHGGGVTLVSHGGGGRAYVGGDDGSVRAFETPSGRKLWRRDVRAGPVADRIDDEPLVHAGTVYVGTQAGSVVALDAETGEEQWRLSVGSPVTASGLAKGDRLVICTDEGDVIGVEIETRPAGRPRRVR